MSVNSSKQRGEVQHLTDRLEPPPGFLRVDEGDYLLRFFSGRPSSSVAKNIEAAFSISLARLSSAFSRSSARKRSCSTLVTPSRSFAIDLGSAYPAT